MLIIGVGNDFRRDDAVGLLVARTLAEKGLAGTRVVECTGEGTQLMELFGRELVIFLIDAIVSGQQIGTVQFFDAHLRPLPTHFFLHSTHAFSVAEAIELARELNRLPKTIVVCGIEGKEFGFGDEISPLLAKAMPKIIQEIGDRIEEIADATVTPVKNGTDKPSENAGIGATQ